MIKHIMKFEGISVSAAGIIRKNGKVLLTKRARKIICEGGKWCLPGGHVKKWEKAEKGLKRELKEEIGFGIKKIKLLFVHEEFVKRLNVHSIVFVFLVDVSGKPKKNFEVSKMEWFGKKEAMKLNLAFTHKDILRRFWK